MHQLRVHMDSIGCPIMGDEMYGPASVRSVSPRLALHAHRVVFPHSEMGEKVDVQVAWSVDLRGVLKRLGFKRSDLDHAPKKAAEAEDESDED